MNDTLRAAVMLVFANAITVGQNFGLIDWTGDQVANVTSLVTSSLILLAYFVKYGQSKGGSASVVTASISTADIPPTPPKP